MFQLCRQQWRFQFWVKPHICTMILQEAAEIRSSSFLCNVSHRGAETKNSKKIDRSKDQKQIKSHTNRAPCVDEESRESSSFSETPWRMVASQLKVPEAAHIVINSESVKEDITEPSAKLLRSQNILTGSDHFSATLMSLTTNNLLYNQIKLKTVWLCGASSPRSHAASQNLKL